MDIEELFGKLQALGYADVIDSTGHSLADGICNYYRIYKNLDNCVLVFPRDRVALATFYSPREIIVIGTGYYDYPIACSG